jgi:hypothetical protein
VIIDLGTEPTTPPKESARPESFKAMQELDLNRGSKDVADYAQRATQGAELGEVELKVELEEMAANKAGRSELRRLLEGLQPGQQPALLWCIREPCSGLARSPRYSANCLLATGPSESHKTGGLRCVRLQCT